MLEFQAVWPPSTQHAGGFDNHQEWWTWDMISIWSHVPLPLISGKYFTSSWFAAMVNFFFLSFRIFYKNYQQLTIWKTVLVICRISQLRTYIQVRTRYLLTIFILNLKSNKFQTNSVLHQARSVNNLIYMVFILKLHRNALLVADPIPLLTTL